MSLPKFLISVVILLFSAIAVAAVVKKSFFVKQTAALASHQTRTAAVEIPLDEGEVVLAPDPVSVPDATPAVSFSTKQPGEDDDSSVDRIAEFFNTEGPRLPIVKTITYKSNVSWLSGRPAWIADYAAHYKTSRHFIARSLNGKVDYDKQNVGTGDHFNVFRDDVHFQFYLLADISRCKMKFYYVDTETWEKVLLKTYPIGAGRLDTSKTSGSLTPLGKYTLGDKVAIYRPKITSFYQGKKTEMIRVFGTRWIPFAEAVGDNTAPAKGFGIHGMPWAANEKGELVEDASSIGRHASDGCIRLSKDDMEELFAIIITKPTTIEIITENG